MLRAINSVSPKTTLAIYIIVGMAVIVVPMIYFWQDCKIDEQYSSDDTVYDCNSEILSILGIGPRVNNPVMLLLYVPLASGIILSALRRYRHKMLAPAMRGSIAILTGLTFAASLFIILGAIFVHAGNEYYQGKQCYIGEDSSEWMKYCQLGTAKTNLSGSFAPIEIALGVICIIPAILYRNED